MTDTIKQNNWVNLENKNKLAWDYWVLTDFLSLFKFKNV